MDVILKMALKTAGPAVMILLASKRFYGVLEVATMTKSAGISRLDSYLWVLHVDLGG